MMSIRANTLKALAIVSAIGISALGVFAYNSESSAQIYPPITALNNCVKLAPYGWPKGQTGSTTPVCHRAYALMHDNVAKIASWTVYTIQPENTIGCVPRSKSFAPDPLLRPSHRAELSDYYRSGYDMGHIVNNGDMRWNSVVEKESFYLSNIAPQLPNLNRGQWRELETSVRDWAYASKHPLTVYAGSIYNINLSKKLGKNKVVVPSAFYKIVIDNTTKTTRAFLFEHTSALDIDFKTLQVPVSRIESLTGLDFPIPDSKTDIPHIWSATESAANARKVKCRI